MPSAHIIGWFSTACGDHPEKAYKDLTREVYLGVLSDAGMSDSGGINVYFPYGHGRVPAPAY